MPPSLPARYLGSAAGALVGSVVFTALLGLLANWIAVGAFNNYAAVLFVLAPALMGFASAVIFARLNGSVSIPQGLGVTALALLLAAFCMLFTRWEGLICLAMVAPIALVTGLVGALVGAALARRRSRNLTTGSILLLLLFPFLAWGEVRLNFPAPASVVTTSIILPARPAEIWPHLQNFTIEAEPEFIGFRAGIAYPLATRTVGTGVGAARACILSTGTMEERITEWNPPHLLGFDVLATPEPMFEMTPFGDAHPPHLRGRFISKHAEFRLESLADGTTRLTGTSWYEQRLWPGWYWLAWSDPIVHAIHRRVFEQIRADVEKDRARRGLVQR